ncbi:winged helix-turn-helix transcriptional regulator [Burkholderia ubonensis]|uniref:Transcriptional regulator, HxlR family protein n=1 Tax=Burkholderia ubonensis subsp. mesacidophila TaxID=265293 RepID=A0A2A4F6A6_9BURK|nr:helix-turn-helix domain-containing protein [Burkholderia ubonensis]PCE29363.1 transcriptional regulator, HxlR family protein [Burkholderia ubonensis subsp. mesacidophila]
MAFPGDVYAADCSARDALTLVAGKWTLLILPALAAGPLRNGELLARIGGISQKVLTQNLRELERNGLIAREDFRARPARVEYRLTPVAESLVATLIALDRWAERHFPELDAARERYDAVLRRTA